MEFASNRRRAAGALVAIAATAVLVYFGNGMEPLWPLMWLAPLPVLLFAGRSRGWEAGAVAFAAWLLGSLSMEPYLRKFHISWVLIGGSFALAFALAVLLYRALLQRGAAWSALVAFPAVWVTFEYLLDRLGTGGTAGSLAYTQLKFLPFLQLASVTGPWGMSFVLLMTPAALAIGLTLRRTAPKTAWRVAEAGVGVLGAVLVFGGVRLAIPQPGARVKVGLIASDTPGGVAAEGAETEKLFGQYAAQAETLAGQGAQAIVLPENLGVAAGADLEQVDALFQGIADRTGATVVVGMDRVSPPERHNEARIYEPHEAVLSYDKRHLLPPFENIFTPGTTLTTFEKPSGTWGVAICKDLDFADPAREYGKAGAGLVMAPAWDFDMDRTWHGHIAVMRAVEDGFSLVRAARHGLLTVSDDRGRVVAEKRSDAAAFATLVADVPAGHEGTVYVRLGDWFIWVVFGAVGFSLLRLVWIGGDVKD